MIQKVLKKILLWLFDSGNNEVFAKAINDIENEIIQNNRVMKANGAPEKLYLLPNGLISYCRTNEDDIEYTRTDAFIEKACDWIDDNLLSANQQDKSRLYFERFRNYMKGE